MSSVANGLVALGKQIQTAQAGKFGLYRQDFAILGKHLKAETHAEFAVRLEKNQSFRVVAVGNDAAHDIDVRVYSPSGMLIAKDTRLDAEALVDFNAGVEGDYRVRLELYKADAKQPAFCAMAVLEPNGHQLNGDDLPKLAARHMVRNIVFAAIASALNRDLTYQRSDSAWSVMGAVLENRGSRKSWPTLQRGRAMVTALADASAIDIDLSADKHRNELPDAEPAVEFEANGEGVALVVSAPSTRADSLTLINLLHVQ